MKTIAILILLVAGCAVLDTTREAQQGLCAEVCDPISGECHWEDCGTTSGGGGGGGGGGGSSGSNTCEAINCSADWQCQQACLNFAAQCLVVCNGMSCAGSCLNWGSPNP